MVALIIKDAKENGGHAYTNASQIPATLGTDNQAYIQRAFTGYVNPPRQVLVYVLPGSGGGADRRPDVAGHPDL